MHPLPLGACMTVAGQFYFTESLEKLGKRPDSGTFRMELVGLEETKYSVMEVGHTFVNSLYAPWYMRATHLRNTRNGFTFIRFLSPAATSFTCCTSAPREQQRHMHTLFGGRRKVSCSCDVTTGMHQ
jgi:hypothetical protein